MLKLKLKLKFKKSDFGRIALFVGFVFIFAFLIGGLNASKSQPQTQAKNKPKVAKEVKPDQNEIVPEDYWVKIDKLNIAAPVAVDTNGSDEDIYQKALEHGVSHYAGTGKPGEGTNIFIFGHSSYLKNKPGNFKKVFRNLDQLQLDDEIIVYWEGKKYLYKVTENKIVEPDDLSVLKKTKNERLTLMTCWPPETYEKRRIVVAKPE